MSRSETTTARDLGAAPAAEVRAASGQSAAGAPVVTRFPSGTRVDRQPFYFGPPGNPCFGCFHAARPAPGRREAVVICPPLGQEYIRAHRALLQLAVLLSRDGFPVLRFDLRGTGDSAGELDPVGLAAWTEDVHLACDVARQRSGLPSVVLVGLRLGATLAWRAAATRDDVASLVLWEPIVSGAGYLRELRELQAAMVRLAYVDPELAGDIDRLDEALGFRLPASLVNELGALDLAADDVVPQAPALIVEQGGRAASYVLARRLRAAGTPVEHVHVQAPRIWLEEPFRGIVPHAVIDHVVQRLATTRPREIGDLNGTTRRPRESGDLPNDATPHADSRFRGNDECYLRGNDEIRPLSERAVRFGPDSTLVGVLTRPFSPAEQRPVAAIFLNAGLIHRVGPNRVYVRMARILAHRGVPCLRFDLSGIGDSPSARTGPGDAEVSVTRRWVAETRSAIDYVTGATGATGCILIGNCSGAGLAFLTAFEDPRVVAAGLINPQPRNALRYYLRLAGTNVTFWRRMLRGATRFDMMAMRLRRRLRRGAGPDRSRDVEPDVALRMLTERGVRILLVSCQWDASYDGTYVPLRRRLAGTGGTGPIQLALIPGANHDFSIAASQDLLVKTVCDWVAS